MIDGNKILAAIRSLIALTDRDEIVWSMRDGWWNYEAFSIHGGGANFRICGRLIIDHAKKVDDLRKAIEGQLNRQRDPAILEAVEAVIAKANPTYPLEADS